MPEIPSLTLLKALYQFQFPHLELLGEGLVSDAILDFSMNSATFAEISNCSY